MVCWVIAVGCGGQVVQSERPAQPEPESEPESEAHAIWPEDALGALPTIRAQAEYASWRPTSVVRLDDTLAVLDSAHAFIWVDGEWRHVDLPGAAPFRIDSMDGPSIHVKGDGHRAIFAGPSGAGIGIYELTLEGVSLMGTLPEWVGGCRAAVASGDHLYAVVSDVERERDGTILHAQRDADDWQPLAMSFPSNTPDREVQMSPSGALLLQHGERCEVFRLPSEGPSFEPTPLFDVERQGSCTLHVAIGAESERVVVSGAQINVYENGETRSVDWPPNSVPYERGSDYDHYEALSPSEREVASRDNTARLSSPGLVGLSPLLFERFYAIGETEQQQGAFRQQLGSRFFERQDGHWVELPEDESNRTEFVGAMHFAALSRLPWGAPVYWGALRIAVSIPSTRGGYTRPPAPALQAWRSGEAAASFSAF